ERAMTRRVGAAAMGKEAEPVVEAGYDRVQAEACCAQSGELESEGKAIEPSADRRGEGHRPFIEHDIGISPFQTAQEKAACGVASSAIAASGGTVERRQAQDTFVRRLKRRLARRDDPEFGCGTQQPFGRCGGRLEKMLAMIQDQD